MYCCLPPGYVICFTFNKLHLWRRNRKTACIKNNANRAVLIILAVNVHTFKHIIKSFRRLCINGACRTRNIFAPALFRVRFPGIPYL